MSCALSVCVRTQLERSPEMSAMMFLAICLI